MERNADIRSADTQVAAGTQIELQPSTRANAGTRVFGLPAAAQEDGPLAPGDFAGDYCIERHLADGGMASVYAARHPLIGKHAAVKVLRAAMSRDAVQTERFLLEARAVNTIQHPNIVDIFAFGELPDGRQFLVMEHLPGETLFARLWHGRLELDRAVAVLLEICDALDAAHGNQIAHLDLKPENIFLVPVGKKTTVKLLDFGIAKLYGSDANEGRNEFVGTPDYASPEQACARPEIDYRSDIYSLGVVAYEMLTGALPLQGPTPLATLQKHVDEAPVRPSTHVVLPVEIDDLVMRMLEKDPTERPSLTEIRETLQRAIEPHSVPISLDSLQIPAPRPERAVLPAIGVALAASLALAIGLAHRADAVAATHPAHPPIVSPVVVVSQPAQQFAAERTVTATPVLTTVDAPTRVQPTRPHGHHKRMHAPHRGVDYLLGYDGKPW